ncbi:MAG: S8 family serine peptidase [Planctomycetota bacterium]
MTANPWDQLAEADGSGVRLAVIDTGIAADHPRFAQQSIEAYRVNPPADGSADGYSLERLDRADDPVGHGTAVADLVHRVAPGVQLISIQLLAASRRGTTAALLAALQHLADLDIHAVNLSLSTQRADLAGPLSHELDEAYAQGRAVVAAEGYGDASRDYPASFASCIGVTYTACPIGVLRYRQGRLVEFEAAGINLDLAWGAGPEATTRRVTGSSYACPIVAGLCARLLSAEPGLPPFAVKSRLHELAQAVPPGLSHGSDPSVGPTDWLAAAQSAPV